MIVSALIFAAHEAIPGRVNLLGNLCEGWENENLELM
jgi:hypothetical protein